MTEMILKPPAKHQMTEEKHLIQMKLRNKCWEKEQTQISLSLSILQLPISTLRDRAEIHSFL